MAKKRKPSVGEILFKGANPGSRKAPKKGKKEPNEIARDLMEFYIRELRAHLNVEGITYPPSTLKRRLGLLNKREASRVFNKYLRIRNMLEYEIDQIISDRAEREGDRW